MTTYNVEDRVCLLLVRVRVWLTADQIAERLGGAQRQNVHRRLMSLARDGKIERRELSRRNVEWRAQA